MNLFKDIPQNWAQVRLQAHNKSNLPRAACHRSPCIYCDPLYSLDPVVRHVEVVEGDGRGGDLLEQVVRQEDAPDAHQAPEGAPLHRLDPVVR